jgi:hypothetical protein
MIAPDDRAAGANYTGVRSKKPLTVGETMSNQDQQIETEAPELELNKESLRDLDVDGTNVKGGAGIIAVAPQIAPNVNPTIRATIAATGTSVI